jgi:hypothetical protein
MANISFLLLFIVGCLSSSPSQDASTTNREHASRKLVRFYSAFADAVVSADGDCALMVSRLFELLDVNQSLLDEVHRIGSPERAAVEQPVKELKEIRTRRWPEISGTWIKCRNENGVNDFVLRVMLDEPDE